MEGSPAWYPAGFSFDPTRETRTRQHLFGDDGLAPYISRLVCRSTKANFVGGRYSKVRDDYANICWRALLTSVRVQDTKYNEMTKLSMTAMS